MGTLGNYGTTAPHVGNMTNYARMSVYPAMPENGWGYVGGALLSRFTSAAAFARIHVNSLANPGVDNTPGALLGSTGELSVGGIGSFGGDLDVIEGPLTTIVQLSSGAKYGVGFAARGGEIIHGMVAAANLPSTYDKNFYFRTSVGSTGPYNPWGDTGNNIQGHLRVWITYVPNSKPDKPTGISPSGLLASTPSGFTATFRDTNETVNGVDNKSKERLNQFKIQMRVKGTTPLVWDALYNADSTEKNNRAFFRGYGGSGSIIAGTEYEWRSQVSDTFGEFSDWTNWTSFTTGSAGQTLPVSSGNVVNKQLTLTPGPFKVVYTHPTGLQTSQMQLQLLDGGVPVRDYTYATVQPSGSAIDINPPWMGAWAPLGWGNFLTWRARAYDSTGAPTAWHIPVPFNTNYRPSTPANLSPSGGSTAYGLPLISFNMADLDDTPQTGLYAEIRLKTDGGTLIATRIATLRPGSNVIWEYQTTAADFSATGFFRFDARGRDANLDGNYSTEVQFFYAESANITVPTQGDFLSAESLPVQYTINGQAERRILLYLPGTFTIVYAGPWEVIAGSGFFSTTIDISGLFPNGKVLDLGVETELTNGTVTRSRVSNITLLLDPVHTVTSDNALSGPIAIGGEIHTSAIRMVRDEMSGVDANNFQGWRIKEGSEDWFDRWNAIDTPVPQPSLFLPLNGTLAGQDKAGSMSATGVGALRVADGPTFASGVEETTNLILNPRAAINETFIVNAGSPTLRERVMDPLAPNGTAMHVITDGADVRGLAWDTATGLGWTIPRTVTGSFWYRNVGIPTEVRIYVYYTDSSVQMVTGGFGDSLNAYNRISLTITTESSKTVNYFRVYAVSQSAGSFELWATDFQLEEKPAATPYVDGDMGFPARWNGAPHASSSYRSPLTTPEATTNLISNPSATINTAGWVAHSPIGFTATLHRDTFLASLDGASFRIDVTANTAALGATCGARTGSIPLTVAQALSARFKVRTTNPKLVPYLYFETNRPDGSYFSGANETIPNEEQANVWKQRMWGRTYNEGMGFVLLYVMVKSQEVGALGSIYFDEVQLEEKPYSTPYVDGSIDGNIEWLGTPHASASKRWGGVGKSFFVEEGTTNLAQNPSGETSSTGITALSATNSRVTTHAYMGQYSIQSVCDGTTSLQGVAYVTATGLALTGSTRTYVTSGYVKGPVGAVMRAETQLLYTDGNAFSVSLTFTLTGEWQRVSTNPVVSDPARTINQVALVIRTNIPQAITFWTDAAQIEEKAYATTYCDGSLGTGYTWAGTAHASASSRAATTLSTTLANRLNGESGELFLRYQVELATEGNRYVFGAGVATSNGQQIGLIGDSISGATGFARVGVGAYIYTPSNSTLRPDVSKEDWHFIGMSWTPEEIVFRLDNEIFTNTRSEGWSPFTATSMYFGGDTGGGQRLNGNLAQIVIFDKALTDKERNTFLEKNIERNITVEEMGVTAYSEFLQERVALMPELATVAESTAFEDTELTYFEPPLGVKRMWALVAVIKDGVNILESFPVNPINTLCDRYGSILTDVDDPTGRRIYLEFMSAGDGALNDNDAYIDTWDDSDLPTVIVGTSLYATYTGTFRLPAGQRLTPLESRDIVRAMKGVRDDKTPIIMCLRDEMGAKIVGRLDAITDQRGESFGELVLKLTIVQTRYV